MPKVSLYQRITTLLEAMLLYTPIDPEVDGTYVSRTFTLATLRAALNATNSTIHKLSKGGDVDSDTALGLGTDGNSFDIAGTTTITSIDTIQIGTVVFLQFDGSLTFTHHSTNLVLPGAANIQTAAGDIAIMYEYATGDWRCINYQRAAAGVIPVMLAAAMDSVTDTAACSVANYFSTLTTTTSSIPTLANGVEGQIKKIQMIVDAGNAVLTPATLTGGTTITFADVGDVAELMYTGGSWQVVALYNTVDGATAPVLA